jgi:hypothetical protein
VELPKITFKGREFVFDYRLNELREITDKGIRFTNLNNQETELLAHAVSSRSNRLLKINMEEISWKL